MFRLLLVLVAAAGLTERSVRVAAEDVALAEFENDFFFGTALAPAQSEDGLDDAWIDWARNGHVPFWANYTERPEERLRFFSAPNVEIDLAKKAGLEVFRYGIDWGRLVHKAGTPAIINHTALRRYREITEAVRAAGMRPMLTLFHHSMPTWAASMGGWSNASLIPMFESFASQVVRDIALGEDEFWVTFNEPTVFALLTYCSGMWPPGPMQSLMQSAACVAPYGSYGTIMSNIQNAHNAVYDTIKRISPSVSVGVAHNVGTHEASSIFDAPATAAATNLLTFPFIDAIKGKLDFCGLNYYGKEITKGGSVAISDDEEYSESGRCVSPDGLYTLLKQFNDRYKNDEFSDFDFIITENGISDATDVLRPSYVIEHLLAVKQAMNEGVPVRGYIHWSMSDNNEWADGYCPKFGMVAVDRSTPALTRKPRPSYHMYANIAKTKRITNDLRVSSWRTIQDAVRRNETRPFCRGSDGMSTVLRRRPFNGKDWRFSHEVDMPKDALDPIVLIPGFTSSVLDAKLTHADSYRDCQTSSADWFPIWVSSAQLSTRTLCFSNNMRLVRHNESGCMVNRRGLEIEPKGFGRTDGVDILNTNDPIKYKLFYAMFESLEGIGYVPGESLRVATYDWRKWGVRTLFLSLSHTNSLSLSFSLCPPSDSSLARTHAQDKCYSPMFLEKVKALIEDTYARANNGTRRRPRRVRLMCHSMGCNIALTFLNTYVRSIDDAWSKTYIAGLIAMGPSWAGAASTPESWIGGPVYDYVPMQLSEMLRPSTSTWPSVLALFPRQIIFQDSNASVWSDDHVIVKTAKRAYRVRDMPELVRDTVSVAPLGPNMYPYVQTWSGTDGGAPNVELHCLYITDVETPASTSFPGGSDARPFGGPVVTSYSEGDGTVNRNSMEVPCQVWKREQNPNVSLHPFRLDGVNHVGMVSSEPIIRKVLRIVTRKEGQV